MRDSSPSTTAPLVALGVLKTYFSQAHLVSEEHKQLLTTLLSAQGGLAALLAKNIHQPFINAALSLAEKIFLPGLCLHFSLRKKIIEQEVLKNIKDGDTQCIILGAGLDTLAARISRTTPTTRFIELDHPASQKIKRACLEGKINSLQFLPLDLSKSSLQEALQSSALFHRDSPTTIIAEGIFMYLSETLVRTILADAYSMGAKNLIFTSMLPDKNGQIAFHRSGRFAQLFLRFAKEPFVWGASLAEVAALLKDCGWRLEKTCSTLELGEAMGIGDTVAEGEIVVVARRG